MNNQLIEEEISRHLNDAGKRKRKQVEENTEYKLAMQDGDLEAALGLVLGILYGSAKNMTEHHRLMKKKRRMDRISEFV